MAKFVKKSKVQVNKILQTLNLKKW